MAIKDFEFPGVELHQEFVEVPATGVSQLGVAVVGYQYKLLPYNEFVYGGTATTINLLDVPGYSEDEYIDTSAGAPHGIIVQDATVLNYTATSSSTELKTVPASSPVADNGKSATVTFDNYLQAGTASTAAFGDYKPQIGDAVEVYVGSATTGTAGLITAIAGKTATVEVNAATVSFAAGTVSQVAFFTQAEGVIDSVTVTETSITFPANATVAISGKTTTVALQDGTYDLLLKYRDAGNTYDGKLGAVDSLETIRSIFGAIRPENPMAVALAFALRAANGNGVYFTTTSTDATSAAGTLDAEVAAFETAAGILEKYDYVYSIVPVFGAAAGTANKEAIIQALITMAEKTGKDNESKIRRSIWYGLFPTTSGEYATKSLVDQLIKTRKDIGASYRAQAVWADDPIYAGGVVDTSAVAAAAAGMRSYEPTYRPISNLPYTFFSLGDNAKLTKLDLKALGQEGIWLVDNNYDGTPVNLRQVTTAVSNNLNKDEESIVANADSIALTLCHVGENLVGCSNISPALLTALQDTIKGIMDRYLLNLTGNVYVGPQLLSWSLDALYQDPVQLDHIYATITCEPPKPFNRFVMTLRIV